MVLGVGLTSQPKMSNEAGVPWTKGSARFDPDVLFEKWDRGQKTLPNENDLRSSIISTFELTPHDNYVYHAIASVTLAQAQTAIHHGAGSGLHAWYHDSMEHAVSRSSLLIPLEALLQKPKSLTV